MTQNAEIVEMIVKYHSNQNKIDPYIAENVSKITNQNHEIEIDLVEERGGKLFGYEFKWGSMKQKTPPKDWLENYKQASYSVIDQDNYLKFVG